MDPDAPPAYLADYADRYADSPRDAASEWFDDAGFGLFLHYGLYSLLAEQEWVQYHREIPPGEYAVLQDYFTADGFDADAIVALARDMGAEYVTFTTRHCESFCLWDTEQTTFNAVEAPAGRDLVAELSGACRDAGLGLFLYYVHGFEWRHPHSPSDRDHESDFVRPDYDDPAPYAGAGHDLRQYLDFVEAQVTELLTEYGPIAGLWLDGVNPVLEDPDPFQLPDLYETIRDLQPQTLISYKRGPIGTEDFYAYESGWDLDEVPADEKLEICKTMIPNDHPNHSWGYAKPAAGDHHSVDEVWELLEHAAAHDANLLLNTGPLPDGSLDSEDIQTLRAVGERIDREGLPQG
jgi:alpha-L-fucosidase